MKTAVLLVDCDLGFVFWLGRMLDRAGYEAFPAKSVPDALKLITELHLSVGLVIVNHALPGVAKLISSLRESQKLLRVITLVEAPIEPIPLDADAQYCKPTEFDVNSEAILLQLVRKVLSHHAVGG